MSLTDVIAAVFDLLGRNTKISLSIAENQFLFNINENFTHNH